MARSHGPFATFNPWRAIGISVTGGLTVGTALIGFVVLPIVNRSASEPIWTAICTAIGIKAKSYAMSPEPAARYASTVRWTYREVSSANGGDAKRGAFVALNCEACHGSRGISDQTWVPSLAGMRAEALVKQLVDYRTGHRYWPIMSAISNALSTQDIRDVAAHYSSLPPAVAQFIPGLLTGGRGLRSADPTVRLVFAGDPARGIAPCAACHGLEGLKRAAPVLAGQHPEYLSRQLEAFRDGLRTNDEGEQMRVVSSTLTDTEVKTLASFLSVGHQ